jgi:putative restriction endonuclease
MIGISPDYVIEVRKDILEEHDGPMLQHGLQGLNERKIILPRDVRDLPDKSLLGIRFQRFKNAS